MEVVNTHSSRYMHSSSKKRCMADPTQKHTVHVDQRRFTNQSGHSNHMDSHNYHHAIIWLLLCVKCSSLDGRAAFTSSRIICGIRTFVGHAHVGGQRERSTSIRGPGMTLYKPQIKGIKLFNAFSAPQSFVLCTTQNHNEKHIYQ